MAAPGEGIIKGAVQWHFILRKLKLETTDVPFHIHYFCFKLIFLKFDGDSLLQPIFVSVSASLLCVCVCVWVHVCACVRRLGWRRLCGAQISHFALFEAVFYWTCAGLAAIKSQPLFCHNAGVAGTLSQTRPPPPPSSWGFEIMSSCLCDMHSYLMSYLCSSSRTFGHKRQLECLSDVFYVLDFTSGSQAKARNDIL